MSDPQRDNPRDPDRPEDAARPREFLDVPHLLDASTPKPRSPWIWYVAGLMLFAILLGSFVAGNVPGGKVLMELFWGLAMFGLLGGMSLLGWILSRRMREEQKRVESLDELTQLRRWQDAAALLEAMLSQPMRTPQSRIVALLHLVRVLVRYHRFSEAGVVCDHLLEMDVLDENTTHMLKAERAMAMLKEDRLVDVDRAISELRRGSQSQPSAALALVELYRDVKTNHAEEAIDLFQSQHQALRGQMGHRIGDVFALAAKAYDMLNRTGEAQSAYEKATLLVPLCELHRRYPELLSIAGRYKPADVPAEAA